jgi:exonuclease I
LSAIEVALVEAFAGAAVTLQHLNTQLALGQEIDLSQHAQAVSAMVRVAAKLGLQRRARNVTPTLSDYLAELRASKGATETIDGDG